MVADAISLFSETSSSLGGNIMFPIQGELQKGFMFTSLLSMLKD